MQFITANGISAIKLAFIVYCLIPLKLSLP